MFRNALMIASLALLTVPGTASARPRPGHPGPVPIVAHPTQGSSRDQSGSCRAFVVVCVGKKLVGGAIGATGDVIGAGAGVVAGGVMDGVVSWAADGAASLLGQIAQKVNRSTRPQLDEPWYRREYAAMAELAVGLSLVFLLLAAGHSILRQDVVVLLRAAFMALPLALLLTFAALTLIGLGLALTDWMTSAALVTSGADPAAAFKAIGKVFTTVAPTQSAMAPFVVFLTAVVTALLALVVWLELELREQAVYVATAFLPLTFVAMVWRPTAIWCRRLTEGLVGLVLSKFAVAVAFALAAGALGHAANDRDAGLSIVVGGCAVLLIAALAPWVIVRLVPFASSAQEQSLNRQHVGGAVRAIPGAMTATGATRMLMYNRFGGPPPGAASPAFAAPIAAAARRADVPVAVIPRDGQEDPNGAAR